MRFILISNFVKPCISSGCNMQRLHIVIVDQTTKGTVPFRCMVFAHVFTF